MSLTSIVLEPMNINVHPVVIIRFICIVFFNLLKIKEQRLFSKKRIYFIYVESMIIAHSPKIVITRVDDCLIFSYLSRYCKDAHFMAIQNGARNREQLIYDNSAFHLKTFFCYGNHVIDLYKKYNRQVENPIVVGSFFTDIYYFNNRKIKTDKKIDICLINQWIENYFDILKKPDEDPILWGGINALYILDQHIVRYVNNYNLSIIVPGKADNIAKDYYNDLFGREVFVSRKDMFTSYEAMDNSKLVLGVNSSMLTEAIGMGKRVLYFDNSEDDMYATCIKKGIWCLTSAKYTDFEDRLTEILNMNDYDYKKNSEAYFNQRIKSSVSANSIPSYEIIKSYIKEVCL